MKTYEGPLAHERANPLKKTKIFKLITAVYFSNN